MLNLYPAITPYAQHQLLVDPPHQLYIEECGNPRGIPILVVHGGPGGGCNEAMRRFFDPQIYRIVLFDQRGCGRSTPHSELAGNTTQALVEDMEAIRKLLNINQWILFGGSWGATLSLVYAQTFPQNVLGLILRGIFLGTNEDINWFYQAGADKIFPDHWEAFVTPIPPKHRSNLLQSYYEILTSSNEVARMAAAKAWSAWEAYCSSLEPNLNLVNDFTNPHMALSLARIECHYFINNCFLTPNQILHDMSKIAHLPGIIIHGRYDMVCPLSNAWKLHNAWNSSELRIIPCAGHSSKEPGVTTALLHATQQMASCCLPIKN